MSENKKNSGRQPFYKTPEELQAAVDRYFKSCEGVPVFDKNGLPVMKRNGVQYRAGETPPTITGLALFLGYKDRRTFTRQKDRSAAFCDVVLLARSRIEEFWEQALMYNDTYQGAVYMLRAAFGWDREECGTPTPAEGVRIVNRAPRDINNGSAQGSGGDPAAAHSLHIDLLN